MSQKRIETVTSTEQTAKPENVAEENAEREQIKCLFNLYCRDRNKELPDQRAYETAEGKDKEELGEKILKNRLAMAREILELPGFNKKLKEEKYLSESLEKNELGCDDIGGVSTFRRDEKGELSHERFIFTCSGASNYSDSGGDKIFKDLVASYGITEEEMKEMAELEWIKEKRKVLEAFAKSVAEYVETIRPKIREKYKYFEEGEIERRIEPVMRVEAQSFIWRLYRGYDPSHGLPMGKAYIQLIEVRIMTGDKFNLPESGG